MASTPDHKPKPPRKSGVAHFFAAASYSAGGLRRLMQESAFRQEAGAAIAIGLGLFLWGATIPELMGFAGLALLLVAVEALNTAIEAVVDHVSPDWAEFARDAKDLGSLAVACVLGVIGLYLVWVLAF